MVTVMSPEGKPIQVSASSLQSAGVQNQMGIYDNKNKNKKNCPKIVNKSKVHFIFGIRNMNIRYIGITNSKKVK